MNVFMVGLTCLNVACIYEWITLGFTDVVCLGRNGFGLYPPMVNNGGSICSDSIICMIFILKTNSLEGNPRIPTFERAHWWLNPTGFVPDLEHRFGFKNRLKGSCYIRVNLYIIVQCNAPNCTNPNNIV